MFCFVSNKEKHLLQCVFMFSFFSLNAIFNLVVKVVSGCKNIGN